MVFFKYEIIKMEYRNMKIFELLTYFLSPQEILVT